MVCGQCSESGTWCINERQYIHCEGPVNMVACLQPGEFCAAGIETCTLDTSYEKTTQTSCGVCSSSVGLGHACTSVDTFKKCIDNELTETNENVCAAGTVCDAYALNSENPCSIWNEKLVLCWDGWYTPTVPSDEENCERLGVGKFPLPGDRTCQWYVKVVKNRILINFFLTLGFFVAS